MYYCTILYRSEPAEIERMEWSSEDVEYLIELWKSYECLHNTKSKVYHDRDVRKKALEEIKAKLDIEVTGWYTEF